MAEDVPAASADEEEAPRVATPPSHQDVVLEENVTDPPASEVEVHNPEAATNIIADANDVVMVEANTAPEANEAPEVNAATPEVNVAAPEVQVPEEHVAPEAHEDNANAPVPPPRPHTMELAFDRGQPVMV